MLKKNITYVNFNDETVTKAFYFNLTKAELLEMEARDNIGMSDTLRRIIATKDAHAMVREFKGIILASFGVKSEDGERFIKSDELRAEFEQSPAYDIVMVELATNDKAAAEFVKGVMPADMSEFVNDEMARQESLPEAASTSSDPT